MIAVYALVATIAVLATVVTVVLIVGGARYERATSDEVDR